MKYALSYDSPLYGRRTCQIRLLPLSFYEVYRAQRRPFEQAVEQFSITGGVPKYLEFFDQKDELLPVIKDVILSKSGFLHEEPFFLLRSESAHSNIYTSILRTISDGNHKLSKIGSLLELDTSKLTPYLSMLIDLEFIEKRVPATEKNIDNSRKGLYLL